MRVCWDVCTNQNVQTRNCFHHIHRTNSMRYSFSTCPVQSLLHETALDWPKGRHPDDSDFYLFNAAVLQDLAVTACFLFSSVQLLSLSWLRSRMLKIRASLASQIHLQWCTGRWQKAPYTLCRVIWKISFSWIRLASCRFDHPSTLHAARNSRLVRFFGWPQHQAMLVSVWRGHFTDQSCVP